MSKIFRNSIFGTNILKFFLKNWSHVNCCSLGYLLNHLEINKIDFFSLDVEGVELEVLKGINFDAVDIKYICVEVWDKDKDKICNFLENKNYLLIKDLSEFNKKDFPNWGGNHNDYLFKKHIKF
ncbi:FkbM family methyltransferase [Candidatus Thioglobus sp.]|nr:FkbM family methyltransferase [Candidatus Thioglobus sp.]